MGQDEDEDEGQWLDLKSWTRVQKIPRFYMCVIDSLKHVTVHDFQLVYTSQLPNCRIILMLILL